MFNSMHDATIAFARAARRAQAAPTRAAIATRLDSDLEETAAAAPWQPPVVGPAPCDECRFRERCGLALLACEAFSVYVSGQAAPRWSCAPRAPTRSRFEVIFRASSA